MKHITHFFTFLVLFIASIMFLMSPVSAVNDDFNDEIFLDEWVIVSGTWSVINTSSLEGADDYYLYGSGTTSVAGVEDFTYEIYDTFHNDDPGYIEFDFNTVSTYQNENSYGKESFLFGTDADQIGFSVKGRLGTSDRRITFEGFTLDSYDTIIDDTWYHIEFTLGAVNINVKIYDSDGNMLYDKSGAYTKPTFETFVLQPKVIENDNQNGYTSTIRIDNIITSGIPPGTESGINWDKSQYTEGETASYTWVLENSFWQGIIYKYQIQILKDGSEIDTVRVSQTGTRYQDVDIAGMYEVKLQYSGLIFTNWQSIDSDSVNVIPQADSYINVPQNTPIKENFTATYLYGLTPITPIINIKELQNDYTYKIIDTKILPAATAGTTYTTNLSISIVGYYVVDLYDNGKGESLATDTIQTSYVYIPPSDVVLSSYINTTQSVYAFGGVISGGYATEDNNFTDYHTKVEVYNVDKDIISFAYEPLHQIDSFDIPISDFDVYSDGDNLYPVTTNFLSGDNRVQLSAYNADGTLNEVIAHKNITISVTDEEGYGLSLSKYTVEENEIFAIKAITPVQASIVIHPLTLMGISDTTILINGTTQISHAFGIEDTYSISLVSSGETKATQIIKVLEGEEITAPIEDEPDVAFDTKFESMLSSGAFVALLIIIACVGAFGKIGGVVGVFLGMVVGISISFLMGYLPAWILFIMVLALCVVFVSKLINSFGGGE